MPGTSNKCRRAQLNYSQKAMMLNADTPKKMEP